MEGDGGKWEFVKSMGVKVELERRGVLWLGCEPVRVDEMAKSRLSRETLHDNLVLRFKS